MKVRTSCWRSSLQAARSSCVIKPNDITVLKPEKSAYSSSSVGNAAKISSVEMPKTLVSCFRSAASSSRTAGARSLTSSIENARRAKNRATFSAVRVETAASRASVPNFLKRSLGELTIRGDRRCRGQTKRSGGRE